MNVKLNVTYTLEMDTSEWRVLSRALRGVPLSEEESKLAKELQERMLQQKHGALDHLFQESRKAMHNIALAKKENGDGGNDRNEAPCERDVPPKRGT